MRLLSGGIVVDSRGPAPGVARLHLADGVPLLRPEEQVFNAMLDGWRNQQLARNLAFSTVEGRERVVRAFAVHADAFRDAVLFKAAYAYGLRRREVRMLDTADFGRNPKAPEFGDYGVCYVRYGKANKGSRPKRRSVLTVWEWAPEILGQWVSEVRPLMAVRGMFTASELVPLLAERGIGLSASQVHRLVSGTPERLSLPVLAALCDILDVTPDSLIATRADNVAPRKAAAAGAPEVTDLAAVRPKRARHVEQLPRPRDGHKRRKPMTLPLPAALRAAAEGLCALKAATGLIIAHGTWLACGHFPAGRSSAH